MGSSSELLQNLPQEYRWNSNVAVSEQCKQCSHCTDRSDSELQAPLTPLNNDPGGFEALTLGHFLIQRLLTAITNPDHESVPVNCIHLAELRRSPLHLSDLLNRTKWDNIVIEMKSRPVSSGQR